MKIFTWLIVFFSLATPCLAQEPPDAPSKVGASRETPIRPSPQLTNPVLFRKNFFWPLVAACGTAAIFDAQMSHSHSVKYPNSTETSSWLLGQRPSLGRYYATFAVMDGGTAFASYKLLRSHRKTVRVIGWGILGGLAAIHTYDDVYMTTR